MPISNPQTKAYTLTPYIVTEPAYQYHWWDIVLLSDAAKKAVIKVGLAPYAVFCAYLEEAYSDFHDFTDQHIASRIGLPVDTVIRAKEKLIKAGWYEEVQHDDAVCVIVCIGFNSVASIHHTPLNPDYVLYGRHLECYTDPEAEEDREDNPEAPICITIVDKELRGPRR